MDKNAIKKYAVWARRELISRVSQKALQYGITDKDIVPASSASVNGVVLSAEEMKQRNALIERINAKGYEQVMEEVAYTWFNRFIALRFMEVNGYLPTHVRVFTDEDNAFKPQILTEAIFLEMDGLDVERVYTLKDANDGDGLFKYLIVVQCNALSAILPGMFQKIDDYTELLFPDNLLRDGSVIEQMIEMIPEKDWKDAVQIIGWLYQYYNSEKKDDVFAALKKNVKITKENIPAATQLFTPDWIVRYMVENSLGRLWIEHLEAQKSFSFSDVDFSNFSFGEGSEGSITKEQQELKQRWKYYLDEAEQEPEVTAQLEEFRSSYKNLAPDQIKAIDPCCGSGHILVYMFDVLMQIYESYGYTTREAVASIVRNNLYGLDIDERAAQLAYFAVMMKARQYDRRFFSRGIQPHVYAIVESNHLDKFAIEYFVGGDAKLKAAMDTIIKELYDAKEYGSILTITPQDWSALYNRFTEIVEDIHMSRETALRELLPMVQVAEALAQKYDVVVTNPPYMGASNMNPKLNEFIKNNYTDYKSDFFSAFVIHASQMTKPGGYCGFFTPYVWMFIKSYEKMRQYLYSQSTIETLIQFEYSAFEEATVPVCSFAFRNGHISKKGCYFRLVDFRGGMEVQRQKTLQAIADHNCGYYYETNSDNFSKIPGSPVAYWVSDSALDCFNLMPFLGEQYTLLAGTSTGDNTKYQRFWAEVEYTNISRNAPKDLSKRWYPCNTGGNFRKYTLNDDHVIDWENDGDRIKHQINSKGNIGSAVRNRDYFFMSGITWNKLSSSNFGVRVLPSGYISDDTARMIVCDENNKLPLIGFLCSNTCKYFLAILSPTMSFTNSELQRLPISFGEKSSEISEISANNIKLSYADRMDFETSWDFQRHPLLPQLSLGSECVFIDDNGIPGSVSVTSIRLADEFELWQEECDDRFNQLKANEEELNRIFINIYGLQDELMPDVADKDVTVRKADLGRDIRSFISYAVGCMFGRYSLDVAGLIYAGGDWNNIFAKTYDYLTDENDEVLLDGDGEPLEDGIEIYGEIHTENGWKRTIFPPDMDNIIPICDDEYFEDDIVGRFVKFVEIVYGAETLDENLKFIADALGGKGQPKEVIRNYFLGDFYKDHCKMYQKRPIYWLFDSGKKNGFKCLIYLHRYQPDTIARIRTDYVHEQQSRYRTAIADLEQRIMNASTSERVKLNKQLKKLQEQADEIHVYEEKIHHLADQYISIDLDDGVKKNYEIFKDVLAKIK